MIKVVDNGVTFFFESREHLECAILDSHQTSQRSDAKARDCMVERSCAVFSESGRAIKNRLTDLEMFERMNKAEQDLQNTLEDM